MIEFTLWGVPVRIHPMHWIGLAILGALIASGARGGGMPAITNPADLLPITLFMIAGFLGILAHEMGHAITGRILGNSATAVTLIFFGGYTEYYHAHFSKHGRSISILAGPAATVVLGILGWVVYIVAFGDIVIGSQLAFLSAMHPGWVFGESAAALISSQQISALYFLGCFMFISFWWTILNLLPIMPLDGGQFVAQYVRSPRRVHLIGVITAAAILLLCLWSGAFILGLFVLIMGFENFKAMKQAPF